jgi:hypothetical protein
MKIDFHCLRLYERLEEGMAIDSIVAYAKVPYYRQHEDANDGSIQDITYFEYRIVINLWFLMLRFRFRECVP